MVMAGPDDATATPTKAPPTKSPTKSPTKGPTKPPTKVPTKGPTATSTSRPTEKVTPTEEVMPTPTVKPDTESVKKIGEFVSRIYKYVLARNPEEGGEEFWFNELYSFKLSGAQIAVQFIFSEEFINRNTTDEEFVAILYWTFFNRAPEQDGFDFWVDSIKTGQLSRTDVANGFINSKEWANTCAEYGILSGVDVAPDVTIKPTDNTYSFVERMYTTAMGRESDEEGKKYWAGELANFRLTGEWVGGFFFLSDEMNNMKLSNKEFVTRLYKTFMDRDPEESGFKFWVQYLDDGNPRADVVYGFTRSAEFVQKCIDSRIFPY